MLQITAKQQGRNYTLIEHIKKASMESDWFLNLQINVMQYTKVYCDSQINVTNQ